MLREAHVFNFQPAQSVYAKKERISSAAACCSALICFQKLHDYIAKKVMLGMKTCKKNSDLISEMDLWWLSMKNKPRCNIFELNYRSNLACILWKNQLDLIYKQILCLYRKATEKIKLKEKKMSTL